MGCPRTYDEINSAYQGDRSALSAKDRYRPRQIPALEADLERIERAMILIRIPVRYSDLFFSAKGNIHLTLASENRIAMDYAARKLVLRNAGAVQGAAHPCLTEFYQKTCLAMRRRRWSR